MPIARWRGTLNIVGIEVPCYVLDNGMKLIGRVSATEVLSRIKGGGDLERYMRVKALEPFINKDLILERMVPFRLPDVDGLEKAVKGLPHDLMIELCQGFVAALQASKPKRSRCGIAGRPNRRISGIGELTQRIYDALRQHGTIGSAAVAVQAMRDKGLDPDHDRVTRTDFVRRVGLQLNAPQRDGKIERVGKDRRCGGD
jgi:hypothetical protein